MRIMVESVKINDYYITDTKEWTIDQVKKFTKYLDENKKAGLLKYRILSKY